VIDVELYDWRIIMLLSMNSNHFENSSQPTHPRLCPRHPSAPKIIYKTSPGDFIVEELPAYEPTGTGTHTWLWVEKTGMTTHAVTRALAQKLHKNPLDAGIAGLKDAQAVTRQWITFENVTDTPDAITAFSDERLKILTVTRHANKLKMGHLRGNRFVLRISAELSDSTAMPAADLLARVNAVFAILSRDGIPNYYGEQRFGNAGTNAAMGRLLVQGDVAGFETAMNAAGQGRQIRDRKMRNLLVNAFQSELFNKVLAARLPTIGTLLPGDLASLHRNSAVFKIATAEDVLKEQTRADAHEISPSGPIFGPKMAQPEGAPGELEARILLDAGVTLADFGRKEAEQQPGARRPLRIFFLEAPTANIDANDVVLRFALPSGSYATEVLNEL